VFGLTVAGNGGNPSFKRCGVEQSGSSGVSYALGRGFESLPRYFAFLVKMAAHILGTDIEWVRFP
jgi:hypothetical protein